MPIQEIFAPVQEEFLQVNETITHFLGSDVPLVDKISRYIVESGGKRLRPLLVILAAKALGYDKDDKHIQLAAIIEFCQ